jgi:hypothetical protein
MTLPKTSPLAGPVLALALAACGGGPTEPVLAPPDVAGTYYATWTLQVLRKSDGFQKQFYCGGRVTLQQAPATGDLARLSGFVVVDSPCAPESYDLTGSVRAGGAVAFTTDGPHPPEGPCPGASAVPFSGQITSEDQWRTLAVRGVATVTCPQFGEHEFTYLIDGNR